MCVPWKRFNKTSNVQPVDKCNRMFINDGKWIKKFWDADSKIFDIIWSGPSYLILVKGSKNDFINILGLSITPISFYTILQDTCSILQAQKCLRALLYAGSLQVTWGLCRDLSPKQRSIARNWSLDPHLQISTKW